MNEFSTRPANLHMLPLGSVYIGVVDITSGYCLSILRYNWEWEVFSLHLNQMFPQENFWIDGHMKCVGRGPRFELLLNIGTSVVRVLLQKCTEWET